MKRSREYWVLVGIAIVVPLLIIAGVVAFSVYLPVLLYPEETKLISGNNITFVLTNKIVDVDVIHGSANGTIIYGTSYNIINSFEFDSMQFNKTYRCQLDDHGSWFSRNNTISNCTAL